MGSYKLNIAGSKDKPSDEGPARELNPGPLLPKARVIPLDQETTGFHYLEIYESGPTK